MFLICGMKMKKNTTKFVEFIKVLDPTKLAAWALGRYDANLLTIEGIF